MDASFVPESEEIPGKDTGESESEDSSIEFYESCYLGVPQSLRGSLHKPSVTEPGLPRCGTKARSFMAQSIEEKLSKKTTFCSKCFGKPKKDGCDKVCAKKKKLIVDGVGTVLRCSRRCALQCERLPGYLDVDERGHLCSVHCVPEDSSQEENQRRWRRGPSVRRRCSP